MTQPPEVSYSTAASVDAVRLAEAAERLRQEQVTFEVNVRHDERYFRQKIVMGWVVVVSLPAILVTCIVIISMHKSFSDGTVTAATTALLVDGLSTLFYFYKLVFATDARQLLAPVTQRRELPE